MKPQGPNEEKGGPEFECLWMKPLLTSKIKDCEQHKKTKHQYFIYVYIIRVFFQFKVYLKHIGETITADEFALTPLCCTFRISVGICNHRGSQLYFHIARYMLLFNTYLVM